MTLHPRGLRAAAAWSLRRLRRDARDQFARGRGSLLALVARRHAGRILLVVGYVTLAVLTIALSIVEGPMGVWLLIFSPLAMMWLSLALGLIAGAAVAFQAVRRAMTDAMLGLRRCPACAYSLAGLDTPGNAARCPECGAAWHAPRLGRDRPPERTVIVLAAEAPRAPADGTVG